MSQEIQQEIQEVNVVIEVAIEAGDWASFVAPSRLARMAILAAAQESRVALASNAEISVVLCDDAFIRGKQHNMTNQNANAAEKVACDAKCGCPQNSK